MLFFVSTDVKNGFDIINIGQDAVIVEDETNSEVLIAENGTFTFTCGVSPKRAQDVEILLNNQVLTEDSRKCTSN